MAGVVRFVVPSEALASEPWRLAVRYALWIASEGSPQSDDVVLMTRTKAQLEFTSLTDHLGDDDVRTLAKGGRVPLPDGATLRHETLRTFGFSKRNTVIIAYYAEDGMMEELDGLNGVAGIVAVPEYTSDIDLWLRRWDPVVHGRQRAAAGPIREPNTQIGDRPDS